MAFSYGTIVPDGYSLYKFRQGIYSPLVYINTSVTPNLPSSSEEIEFGYYDITGAVSTFILKFTSSSIAVSASSDFVIYTTSSGWNTDSLNSVFATISKFKYIIGNTYFSYSNNWLYVDVEIPDGYVHIEPNVLYENVDYFIDTSVEPTSVTSLITGLSNIFYITHTANGTYGNLSVVCPELNEPVDNTMNCGLAYLEPNYKYWANVQYMNDGKAIYYSGIDDSLDTYFVLSDVPTLNIYYSVSPEWLYVKEDKTMSDDAKAKGLINKVSKVDESGNATILLDVSNTTATDETVYKDCLYTRSDGSQGVGTMINTEFNIAYNNEVPANTNMLWVACNKADKVVVQKDTLTEFESDVLYITPNLGGKTLKEVDYKVENLNYSAYGIGAVAVGHKIYIFGGRSNTYYDTITVYNTITDTYETLSVKLPKALSHMAVVAVGTNIYLFGGRNGYGVYKDIYVFNTIDETISTLENTTLSLAAHSIGYAVNGTDIYLFGGMGTATYGTLDIISVFDTTTNTLTRLTNVVLPLPKSGIAASVLDNKIYLFGGGTETSGAYINIYVFDIAKQTCEQIDVLLPMTLRDMGAVTIDDAIYVFGGSTGDDTMTTKENYTIYKFNGTELIDTGFENNSGSDMGVAFVNNSVYTFGGFNNGSKLGSNYVERIVFGRGNIFKLFSSERMDFEMCAESAYYNGQVDSYLYNTTTEEWVNINTGNTRLVMEDAAQTDGTLTVNAVENASSYELYQVTEE